MFNTSQSAQNQPAAPDNVMEKLARMSKKFIETDKRLERYQNALDYIANASINEFDDDWEMRMKLQDVARRARMGES
jgi:hypothetical protein